MSETVLLDYEIKSSIDRVWHALTDPGAMAQWMFFDAGDFQPVVGHHFQFRGKASIGWPGVIECVVLEVDAPYRLSYTWATDGEAGRHQTTVAWTLTESDNGVTQLHLEQGGFDPAAKQEIGGAKYGWTHQLSQLSSLLAPPDDLRA